MYFIAYGAGDGDGVLDNDEILYVLVGVLDGICDLEAIADLVGIALLDDDNVG